MANTTNHVIKHGLCHAPGYNSWRAIKDRCCNPRCKKYPDYGGRGIKVCDRWLDDFGAFYADMGPKPSKRHSIDRIDNDGDYTPENCRWATPAEQNRNTRITLMLTCNGKTQSLSDWADETGGTSNALHMRLRRGWSVEEAINRPFTRSGGYRNQE